MVWLRELLDKLWGILRSHSEWQASFLLHITCSQWLMCFDPFPSDLFFFNAY